ncbi:DUF3306 domain-containing protein [Photobacterium ganghwense]|uniref:DUF3306 domain-containing protein n=1 Tax=Photobacterium ganghwense TaxID=320778 RepID=UPI001A8E2435|nr:DUF3306 domain-containing protein [Photobacterium ganghwense]QSV15422.1 DUF3306 domain-containing protein [Photobacterium ganghwense]
MATNFFQRWSSRKLKARESAEQETELGTEQATAQTEEGCTASTGGQTANPEHADSENLDRTAAATASEHMASDSALDAGSVSENDSEHRSKAVSEEALSEGGEVVADPLPTLADVSRVSYESGVTSFMQQGVDKSVKKAALRKLFHSEEFNYISDMDDHTEDFSNVPVLDKGVTQQLRNWFGDKVETAINEAGKEATDAMAQASPQTVSRAYHEELQAPHTLESQSQASSSYTATTETSPDSDGKAGNDEKEEAINTDEAVSVTLTNGDMADAQPAESVKSVKANPITALPDDSPVTRPNLTKTQS